MYEIEILGPSGWMPYASSYDIQLIDHAFLELMEEEEDEPIQLRYLENDRVRCFLRATEHDYIYWKENYRNEDSLMRKAIKTHEEAERKFKESCERYKREIEAIEKRQEKQKRKQKYKEKVKRRR